MLGNCSQFRKSLSFSISSDSKERNTKHIHLILSFALAFLLLFAFSIIPLEFCHAVGTPSYFDSRVYPQGLVDEGSTEAGIKGFSNEYGFFSTSQWTQFAFDLKSGGLVCQANLIQIPGTILPLTLSLTYSSKNANVDIGLGKGWMTNLHSCVSEDAQTHDLTYVTPTGSKMVFEYDSQTSSYDNPKSFTGFAVENQDGTYTIQTLDGQIANFSSNGKLASLSSLTGGLLVVGYDGSGRPETLTDSKSSREITLTWDVNGILTGAEDMLGNTWSFSYTSSNLTEIQQPSDEVPDPDIHTTFGYDANHMLTSQVDFEGFEYEITYHSSGYQANKVATFVEPTENAATSEFTYQEDQEGYDKKTTLTDGEDRNTYYYFSDTTEHLMKVSMVNNTTVLKTEYEYNALGLVSTISDSYDKETTLTYDDVGHIETITYPPPSSGGTPYVQQFTYYPEDSLIGKLVEAEEKVTDSVWATTTLAYTDNDAPFSPSLITDPLSQDVVINYNLDGQPVSVTQETTGGTKTATMEYDATSGCLEKITDAEGNETTFSYNANGFINGSIQYEGDEQTADIVRNLTIYYSEVSQNYQISNSTTGESSSTTSDDNGAETGSESVTDCITLFAYTYTNESSVTFLMPIGISYAVATIGAGGSFAGIGAIGFDPITLPVAPYDPNPFQYTDTMGHTAEYGYFEDGAVETVTNYLSQTTTYTQDVFGRSATATNAFGRLSEYTYNLNSWMTDEEVEGIGTYTLTFNDRGEVTSVSDPIKGTLNYTYNVRGDVLTAPDTSFTRDILGRKTNISYTGGASDSFTYTPEGWLSSLSDYDFSYDAIGNLNTWSDEDSNTATMTYNPAAGSQVLGLPSALTGTGDLSSYSFTYTGRNWLNQFTDTSKGKTFSYIWDNDRTLVQMNNPNNTALEQTWDNKILDNVTVEYGQDTYLSTTSDFSSEDQKTAYSYSVYAGQGQTFSESYAMTYDALKRISEIEYGSSSETLTFNYDASVGKLTSIDDSEEADSFDYAYDAKERLSSVTLPNSQGTISYTYDDTSSGKGRLDYITYPNDRSIDLSWDVLGRVTQLAMDDDGSVTTYYLSYNDAGQVKQILKSEGGLTVHSWNYVYGLYGVEKATVKDASNVTILTQDYTTDPFGKILSMTYTPTQNFGGSYTGELYFHYDNYGNTALLTDNTGVPKASYEYDLHSGEKINEWNVLGIINPYMYGGGNQEITIPEPWTGGGIVVIGAGDLTTRDNGNTTVITDKNVTGGMTGGSAGGETKPCGRCDFPFSKKDCEKLVTRKSMRDIPQVKVYVVDFAPSEYNCQLIYCCYKYYSDIFDQSVKKIDEIIDQIIGLQLSDPDYRKKLQQLANEGDYWVSVMQHSNFMSSMLYYWLSSNHNACIDIIGDFNINCEEKY